MAWTYNTATALCVYIAIFHIFRSFFSIYFLSQRRIRFTRLIRLLISSLFYILFFCFPFFWMLWTNFSLNYKKHTFLHVRIYCLAFFLSSYLTVWCVCMWLVGSWNDRRKSFKCLTELFRFHSIHSDNTMETLFFFSVYLFATAAVALAHLSHSQWNHMYTKST